MDRQQIAQLHMQRARLALFNSLLPRSPDPTTGHLDPIPNSSNIFGDLPVLEQQDLDLLDLPLDQSSLDPFERACRNGDLTAMEALMQEQQTSGPLRPTPAFLHHGLVQALMGGQVVAAGQLLRYRAPIVRETPGLVLGAPASCRIALFELLYAYGWTPNRPGFYGRVLLPATVEDKPLLTWFLSHGADPNLGYQRYMTSRSGGPDTDSCLALEQAAALGSPEVVTLLLQHGARVTNGNPLHRAASAGSLATWASADGNAGTPPTIASPLDEGRIPVMELLVAAGADVNGREKTRHMTEWYPLVYAMRAGAVQRAVWLVQHGADPSLAGPYGSALDWAKKRGVSMTKALEKVVAEVN